MINKTGHGWAKVTIGDFCDYASYITDVPNEILDALINLFKTNCPQCVYFDGEGSDFYVVFDKWEVFVIDTFRKLTYVELDIGQKIFNEILDDIKNNIDIWAEWNPSADDLSESEISEERDNLFRKIEELEKLLK